MTKIKSFMKARPATSALVLSVFGWILLLKLIELIP
jgi:hypothetical protein